jgi:predicted DNA-binding ribbon-helix-helix protein
MGLSFGLNGTLIVREIDNPRKQKENFTALLRVIPRKKTMVEQILNSY